MLLLYTDLVKFENIEELEQFPVLLGVLELDVVLLETVESQLSLVINVDLVECGVGVTPTFPAVTR